MRIFLLTCLFVAILLIVASCIVPPPTVSPISPPPSGTPAAIAPVLVPTPIPTPWGGMLQNSSMEGQYVCDPGLTGFCTPPGWVGWRREHNPCYPGKPGKPPCELSCPEACQKSDGSGICGAEEACYWALPELASIGLQFPYRVHSGETAFKIFVRGRMFEGGLYQQVYHVPLNSQARLSAYMQAWQCFNYDNCQGGHLSDLPATAGLAVGIDPYGGIDPYSPNIVWSDGGESFDAYKKYETFTIARNQVVTAFLRCAPRYPDFLRSDGNDCYMDDANLSVFVMGWQVYVPLIVR